MRFALAQMEVLAGQPRKNLEQALRALDEAVEKGAEAVLYPEMALGGYLLGDLWERLSFVKELLDCQEELKRASVKLPLFFGGLGVDFSRLGNDGRPRKYNALFAASDGQWLWPVEKSLYPFSIKHHHPNYREFDDTRYFFDTGKLALELGQCRSQLCSPYALKLGQKKVLVGGLLCEDGWQDDYDFDPAALLVKKGAQVLVNLSASPFTQGKEDKRHRVFGAASARHGVPIYYCNCTGQQNNGKSVYSFDGSSACYTPAGKVATVPAFKNCTQVLDEGDAKSAPSLVDPVERLSQVLIYGTQKFLELTGIKKVVIGVSGGIDSGLSAALYSKVLAPEQLVLLNLPSRYNSNTTRSAAKELAMNLGAFYGELSIEQARLLTEQELKKLVLTHGKTGKTQGLEISAAVSENIQARDRSARVLAAVAASVGGGFSCNANKSELTVGYGTLYGDLAGFLAQLGDLWKGDVYKLSHYLNKSSEKELIPQSMLNVKPSAELSENQNPEKNQGDPLCYPYHDQLFRRWVEDWNRKSPEEVLEWYADGSLAKELQVAPELIAQLFPTATDFVQDLEKWWRLYTGLALAKRIQAPPILATSRRAFGFDHREAQTLMNHTSHYEKIKKVLLKQV